MLEEVRKKNKISREQLLMAPAVVTSNISTTKSNLFIYTLKNLTLLKISSYLDFLLSFVSFHSHFRAPLLFNS